MSMQSTMEQLAAPLTEEKQRLVAQRDKLAGDFNEVQSRYNAKLAQIEGRLEILDDALGVLLGPKEKKSRNGKRSAPLEEVKEVFETVIKEKPSLAAEELCKEIEARIKAKHFSCSGLKQRVKKLIGESSAAVHASQEERNNREREPVTL